MNFYTQLHKHYCGIALHAKTMYICIMNGDGKILLHQNMNTRPELFEKAITPYLEDLVIYKELLSYTPIWR